MTNQPSCIIVAWINGKRMSQCKKLHFMWKWEDSFSFNLLILSVPRSPDNKCGDLIQVWDQGFTSPSLPAQVEVVVANGKYVVVRTTVKGPV